MDTVFRYVPLPLDYKYGSNSIPLAVACILAISSSGDAILELGMGSFSTPLLHSIAASNQRMLVSVDTDLNWLEKFLIYNKTSNHLIYHLEESEQMLTFGLDKTWSLVLVDHIDESKRFFFITD